MPQPQRKRFANSVQCLLIALFGALGACASSTERSPLVLELSEIADDACACRDDACVESVRTRVRSAASRADAPDEAEVLEARRVGSKISECMRAAIAASVTEQTR